MPVGRTASAGDAVGRDVGEGGAAARLQLLPLDLVHVRRPEHEHARVGRLGGRTISMPSKQTLSNVNTSSRGGGGVIFVHV